MALLDETTDAGFLNASLQAGIDQISDGETVTFVRYVKLVLPMDKTVFWVRGDLVSESALIDDSVFNGASFADAATTIPAATITAPGSLHYATDSRQNEDENISYNKVIFSTSTEIEAFNVVNPQVLWLGTVDDIRFAFSKRGNLIKSAGIYHYMGDAVFPIMDSVIIDNVDQFDVYNVVVSNSLPIWLTLNKFMPMYPSYLIDENLRPPYASVHINPDSTRAIASAATIMQDGSHYQLVTEEVKITTYGLRNFNIMDFIDYVADYSLATDDFGFMNSPVPRDEKRTQNEMNVIAVKKTVVFQISYYQSRARDIAVKYIQSCVPSFIVA